MSIFLLQLLLSLVLWTQHLTDGVAPGDEESLCDDLRATRTIATPDYAPTMRVLMDTVNYNNLLPVRSGSVWEQVDNDNNNPVEVTTNWIQNSNNPCRQTVQVCGFTAGAQDNWLITQLINRTVNRTRLSQVSVKIEFEQRNCDVTLGCQRTFNTHVYERSSENTAASKTISNYRQVQRVSPDDTSGNRMNETVIIDFATTSQESSFYFAVQDEVTCIVITRMIVFYHVCPQQTSDLIHYPETIAPRLPTSDRLGVAPISVTASCLGNAATENGRSLSVFCSSAGVWSTQSDRGCVCSRGFVNQGGACTVCRAGTYASPSNSSCSACPAKSFSLMPGLSQCTCVNGYYRALQGEEDLPCYLPPTSPQDLSTVILDETTVRVTWKPPVQPGADSDNLTYGVYLSVSDSDRMKLFSVTETRAVISNLLPGRSYTVSVTSENAITDQVPADQFSTIAASLTFILPEIVTTVKTADSSLAVIITVPIILLLLIAIVMLTVVIIVLKIRPKVTEVEESYYSQVGLPPLPMRIERNTSNQGAHTATTTEKESSFVNEENEIKLATTTSENTAYGAIDKKQEVVSSENPANVTSTENLAYGATEHSVTTSENTAYQANELNVTLTENTAYGATDVAVTLSGNPAYGAAYGATQVTVTTSENPAYGAAYGATQVTVTTSENPAYGVTVTSENTAYEASEVAVTTSENPVNTA